MSYHNESRVPLGPNMREKHEFSRTTTHKDTSSLRIPDDTSWPKIPERRLHENVVNNSKAPCVVALTRKPQKIRTAVQLPHSQFIKTALRRDGLDRNNAARNSTPLQTSANERYTSTCTDSKFKTTITTAIASTNIIKPEHRNLSEHAKKDLAGNPDQDNAFLKTYERSAMENRENPCDRFSKVSNTEANKSSAMINQDVDVSSNSLKNSISNNLQESRNRRISNDYQDNAELDNNYEGLTGINDEKKENSYNSSTTAKENQERIQYLPAASPESPQWMSMKLRPPRTSSSSSGSDFEVCSTDTMKIEQSKIRGQRVAEGKDCTRKCCYKPNKYPLKKVEFDTCCCIRCERFWSSKKCAPHSEPQIGRRRRCTTAHGRVARCCSDGAKDIVSDSDCRATMHANERRRRAAAAQQRLVRTFEDFVSCPDALRALFLKEGLAGEKQNELAKLLREKSFPGGRTEMDEEHLKYACQLAMGAPQIKKRKSENDNFKDGTNVDPDASSNVNHLKGATTETIEKSTLSSSWQAAAHLYNGKNPPREKQADSRLFNLKTAVLLGCFISALVLALPSIYDYFFYEEEYDEELGYLELILDYIVSSFQEAFAGLVDLFGKIFLQSRTCRKCSNSN